MRTGKFPGRALRLVQEQGIVAGQAGKHIRQFQILRWGVVHLGLLDDRFLLALRRCLRRRLAWLVSRQRLFSRRRRCLIGLLDGRAIRLVDGWCFFNRLIID